MPSLLDELLKRQLRAEFSAEGLCRESAPQLQCQQSRAKRKIANAGRRAGKTRGVIAPRFLEDAITPPYGPLLFLANTRRQAKEIIWEDLLILNQEYALGGVPNLSDLVLYWPDKAGARIMLAGANNERETAKIRGKKFKGVGVDEFQSMPDRTAKPLLLDIIGPTLVDFQGWLMIGGTPGPVPAGFFHEMCAGKLARLWERHHWTLRDNPYLHRLAGKTGEQILTDIREEHGWTEDNPTYRREYLGEWVHDGEALVFKWDADRNGYEPGELPAGNWTYVMGVDLGYDDADAVAVLGWSDRSPNVYLIDEHVAAKQGITELGQLVADAWKARKPIATDVDPGGLGKKIIEELRRRWSLPCQAAEKTRKFEHIELLNDALRTGRFKAPRDSRFAEDCMRVTWDIDARARGQLRVSDAYHSDICDAVLYAFRRCMHYLWKEPAPPATAEQKLDDWERREAERIEKRDQLPWWEEAGDLIGYGR